MSGKRMSVNFIRLPEKSNIRPSDNEPSVRQTVPHGHSFIKIKFFQAKR